MARELRFNPFSPSFRTDPYPVYERLRREDPVHCSPLGFWLLSRYEHVRAALTDPRFRADTRNWRLYGRRFVRRPEGSAIAGCYSRWMLLLDAPDHRRLRSLVSSTFTPARVELLRPRIQLVVDELLDRIAGRGEADFVREVAYPLPVAVICEMLGIPRGDRERMALWSRALVPTFDPVLSLHEFDRAEEAVRELLAYFGELAHARQREPGEDLLSALLAAAQKEDRLSRDELLATCVLLLFAGHLSTVSLLANGLWALLSNPGQKVLLESDPALVESAVEEVLRYENPVHLIYRATAEAVELAGATIPAGELVLLSLASANRDPQQFPDPDRFDVRRRDGKALAFGHGVHHCLGAAVARLEAQILFTTVLRRLPRLRLGGRPVGWSSSLVFRGLASLPVEL